MRLRAQYSAILRFWVLSQSRFYEFCLLRSNLRIGIYNKIMLRSNINQLRSNNILRSNAVKLRSNAVKLRSNTNIYNL